MIKKEDKSDVNVPANSNLTSGSNAPSFSLPVPFSAIAQVQSNQQSLQQASNNSQISGQPASVISMSWVTSSTQQDPNSVNSTIRTNNMPVNTIQNSSSSSSADLPQQTIRVIPGSLSTQALVSGNTTPHYMNVKVTSGQTTSSVPHSSASTTAPIRVYDSKTSTIHNTNIGHHNQQSAVVQPTNTLQHSVTQFNSASTPQSFSQTHPVLSASPVQLTVPATLTAKTTQSQIRSNIGIIQDNKSLQIPHQASTTHHPVGNHSLHHISSNIHHLPTGISNNTLSSTTTSQQQQFQRLKVEDALSYLDQVKFKFNNQPQVYNDFLDIMKEFKSQSIDTPGVIQRVSSLFRGHPELIVGFNTFLPPGYKIEMQANDQVNVSMPNRTTSAIIISGPPTSIPNTVSIASTQNHNTLPSSNQHSTPSVHLNSTSLNSNNNNNQISYGSNNFQPSLSNSSTISNQNQIRNTTPIIDHSITNNINSSINNTSSAPSQPVEFNHAINYVNKIKNRFQGQPEVYKQFLEILHAYQKEQKIIKEGKTPDTKPLTESEVYSKVAKLFQNQEDLLQEFGQFLPESNSATSAVGNNLMFGQSSISGSQHYSPIIHCSNNANSAHSHERTVGNLPNSSISTALSAAQHVDNVLHRNSNDHGTIVKRPIIRTNNNSTISNLSSQNSSSMQSIHSVKRQTNTGTYHSIHSPCKKPKMTSLRDITFAEAGKFASLNEYAFFDKVRKVLKNPEVYDNFLRFLVLYNHEIISKSELLSMMTNFLGKYPELLKWFRDFLGQNNKLSDNLSNNQNNSSASNQINSNINNNFFEGLTNRVVGIRERERERMNSEVGMEIDYNSCKRYGASYRALPKNYVQPKCSGRTQLCKDVLNDIWVSFPSWSEDSTFVTSRKTQYEEYIYRCEDERFELDVVIETNLTAIRTFEAIQKKLNRMTPEERNKFRLDDTLGGNSVVIIQRAIKRIYGDKAPEIVEGLKKSPSVAIPLVYRRLRAKEEEWREAQKQFNKIWREQNEKYYLKSLDHQGISFKQNDIKFLRSKSLINEIESIFDERHEQNEDNFENSVGPHMTLLYKNKAMIEEACNLIIHHVKRQTSIHKADKQKIKQLLRHFIPDLFGTVRGELSDDELEDLETDEVSAKEKDTKSIKNSFTLKDVKNCQFNNINNGVANQKPVNPILNSNPNDLYSLFIVNQSWYLFFRLHHILCDRLGKMYNRSCIIAEDESREKSNKKTSPAMALRLKQKSEYEEDNYFVGLIDMVKQVLDGNSDSNQYEDQLREMFGIYAYISFTLDKVVQNIVRQLQHIVCDETSVQSTELFLEASKYNATGGSCLTAFMRASQEYAYQKKAENLLNEDNIFKIILYKEEGKLTIELLDSESTDSEDELPPTVKWSDYIEKYAKENNEISDFLKQKLIRKPLFLLRNIKALKENNNRDLSALEQEENIENATNNLEINENSECKFDVNSFKAVFLTDTGSYLYRTKSLVKARLTHKDVCLKLKNKFDIFHQAWVDKNCTKEQIQECIDWLNSKPCEEKQKSIK